jgi:hypothetical protein
VIFAAVVAEASGATFPELMDHVAQGFEALGAAILVVGVVWSFVWPCQPEMAPVGRFGPAPAWLRIGIMVGCCRLLSLSGFRT